MRGGWACGAGGYPGGFAGAAWMGSWGEGCILACTGVHRGSAAPAQLLDGCAVRRVTADKFEDDEPCFKSMHRAVRGTPPTNNNRASHFASAIAAQ